MKIVILITLLCSFVFGYEEPIDDRKAFDTLLIKMGITSLTKDFENEKENILKNTNDTEELKQQVKFLLQENLKLKLNVSYSNLSEENQLLKDEIEKLKQKSNKVQSLSNNNVGLQGRIFHDKASSVDSPYPNSKVVKYYSKGDILEIEMCNKYGWCKIMDNQEYIAQYKLYFFKE